MKILFLVLVSLSFLGVSQAKELTESTDIYRQLKRMFPQSDEYLDGTYVIMANKLKCTAVLKDGKIDWRQTGQCHLFSGVKKKQQSIKISTRAPKLMQLLVDNNLPVDIAGDRISMTVKNMICYRFLTGYQKRKHICALKEKAVQ